MSSPTPEPSAASPSSILQAHALNSNGQKRPHAPESEHKRKKRKRETNLEPSSSVIAATGVSQSPAPPSSIATPTELITTGSSRKDKDKKRKKRKRKMSIVTSEIEDDRVKRKRENSLVKAAPANAMVSVNVRSSVRIEPDSRVAEVVADFSNADKGKGKEKARERALSSALSTHAPNSSMALGQCQPGDMAAQQLIDDLKQQIETQSQLLKRHQTHLASVQQSLTCQICLDLLYKPFALAPCGHVACYDCLVRWFTAPGPEENQPDNRNATRGRATANGMRGNHVHKRKTCPICRARVSERPVEVWGMKDMVNALVRSKLAETPSTSGQGEASSSNDQATDPWQRIFRSVRNAYGGRHPFNPWWQDWTEDGPVYAPERVDGPLEDVGMFDAEDHVYRCLDCMHEIWGGRCSSCDREYPGHPEAGDEDEDEDEEHVIIEGDYSDDELYGHGLSLGDMLERIGGRDGSIWPFGEGDTEDEEEYFTDEGGDAWRVYGSEGPLFAHIGEEEEEESEEERGVVEEVEEEEEEEYESSFINDSDDEEEVGNVEYRRRLRSGR